MRFKSIAALSLVLSVASVGPAEAQDYVYGGSGGYNGQLVLNGTNTNGAWTTTIGAVAQGWCYQSGVASASCNGQNPGNNYIVGYFADFRNWFQFDIPYNPGGIAFGPISSASLRLNTFGVVGGPNLVTYYDIISDVNALGTGSYSSYVDQGTGVVYGSRVYTTADNFLVQDITLNSAGIASIVANEDSRWALGGAMTANASTVPEPGSLTLLATGLVAVFGAARRRWKAASSA